MLCNTSKASNDLSRSKTLEARKAMEQKIWDVLKHWKQGKQRNKIIYEKRFLEIAAARHLKILIYFEDGFRSLHSYDKGTAKLLAVKFEGLKKNLGH